jgi:four helix bundle protein
MILSIKLGAIIALPQQPIMSYIASGHRSLRVWRQALELALAVYDVSASFPHHEQYGLTSQLRRAAVAVPSNIAEGNGRSSRADFARFLSMARGSLREVDTLLEIAKRRAYVAENVFHRLYESQDHLSRMLTRMISKLQRTQSPQRQGRPRSAVRGLQSYRHFSTPSRSV